MGERPQAGRLPVIRVQRVKGRPLHRQLYEILRDAILSGNLRETVRLPSTRALANTLGISRNTVLSAYEDLRARNYLVARTGSGTYVNAGPHQRFDRSFIPAQAFISPSRTRPELRVTSILKESHYPVQRLNFGDQDGSSLYLYVSDALLGRRKI